MTAFYHPIEWFLETLRLWREREEQALVAQLANDAAEEDVHHEFNTAFWFLPPPC